MDRLRQAHALGVQTVRQYQPRRLDLPGHRVVLQRALGRALHHHARAAVVEERPHHVVGRDHVGKTVAKDLARAGGDHLVVHAGAVVAPHARNQGPQPLGHADRGVRRQHAALRVAAHVDPLALGRRGLELDGQVAQGLHLRLHDREAQHEVLLPAHQGRVGPAEGHQRAPVVQVDRERRELQDLLGIDLVDVVAHSGVAKALGRRQGANKAQVDGGKRAHVGRKVVSRALKQLLQAGAQGARPLARRGRDAGQVQVGQGRHDDVVDVVEGPLGQRDVASPLQVIANVSHGCLLPAHVSITTIIGHDLRRVHQHRVSRGRAAHIN